MVPRDLLIGKGVDGIVLLVGVSGEVIEFDEGESRIKRPLPDRRPCPLDVNQVCGVVLDSQSPPVVRLVGVQHGDPPMHLRWTHVIDPHPGVKDCHPVSCVHVGPGLLAGKCRVLWRGA